MEYYETQPATAVNMLRDLLKNHPDYLATYFKTATLLWEMEEWSEANDVFIHGIALAEKQQNLKALQELKSAYQNFEFDRDD